MPQRLYLQLGSHNATQRAMDTSQISSPEALREWLADKPVEWAQIVASRVALRCIPDIAWAAEHWVRGPAIMSFRGVAISWAARNFPAHDMAFSVENAVLADRDSGTVHAVVAAAANNSGDAAAAACFAARNAANSANEASYRDARAAVWACIRNDCGWLAVRLGDQSSSRVLSRRSLWLGHALAGWQREWRELAHRLHQIDSNYSVWIDWFERRIRGERAAFDIPGDKGRKEDKKILIRLAEATDEGFWGKGHEYVNATLKGWLDEARERVAPVPEIETPPQEAGAIAYGVNAHGKLDRLPPSDQVHLRDVPNQRRSYADLRAATGELLEEGQRLGPRLHPRLERFAQSLPERFEDAEAYLVWRDGIALRRLYRAHLAVAHGKDPDPTRLDAAAAEGLGGVLDLYNAFAFADEGIRAKDETTIPPQERVTAETEAAVARPLVEAILATPDIATPEALDDIAVDAEFADLPTNDPYAGQVLAQANRTKRNWIAGLLEGARNALNNPKLLGKRTAIGIATGAGTAIGAVATKSVLGFNYAPLLEFVATNGAILQSYVTIAYSSFPSLPDLIVRIGALWNRIRQG